jgi:hypothetical protein
MLSGAAVARRLIHQGSPDVVVAWVLVGRAEAQVTERELFVNVDGFNRFMNELGKRAGAEDNTDAVRQQMEAANREAIRQAMEAENAVPALPDPQLAAMQQQIAALTKLVSELATKGAAAGGNVDNPGGGVNVVNAPDQGGAGDDGGDGEQD